MNTDDQGMNLAEKTRTPRQDDLLRNHKVVSVRDADVPADGLPDVDWECVAGRAFKEKLAAEQELKRLRRHVPADVLREYDRLHHGAE
jgi:hypothetical protein